METLPFDPADYLDTEEAIAAYLADARLDGAVALSRAVEVVARARARIDSRGGAMSRKGTSGQLT
jgi:DNA-binding phage protein